MEGDDLFVQFRLAIDDYSKESDGMVRLDLVKRIHSAFTKGGLSLLAYDRLLVLLHH